ncbi:MAG: D-alanyl-D-alanine carboxypeptidase family protein [Moorea sp. SIO2B7]|nr:D-alanyl-D-alanine carboxypeptidase family protein [Moorena sp. SIO2B7]
MDDIPEALRETSNQDESSRLRPRLIIGVLLGVGTLALLTGAVFLSIPPFQSQVTSSPELTAPDSSTFQPKSITLKETDNLLGHLSYQETSESDLIPIESNVRLRLRRNAATKFREMQAAARADGIILKPISAFRTVAEQQYLFFQVKEQRGQVATKRAEVSAPPGYSEHHTGYAIDIGDGRVPSAHLSPNFEKTSAFRWLDRNAPYYSFELSFPRNNPQGINYEPWHWRFVGDRHSLETFYKARNLQKSTSNE